MQVKMVAAEQTATEAEPAATVLLLSRVGRATFLPHLVRGKDRSGYL